MGILQKFPKLSEVAFHLIGERIELLSDGYNTRQS
jgi:hypothetical protein